MCYFSNKLPHYHFSEHSTSTECSDSFMMNKSRTQLLAVKQIIIIIHNMICSKQIVHQSYKQNILLFYLLGIKWECTSLNDTQKCKVIFNF